MLTVLQVVNNCLQIYVVNRSLYEYYAMPWLKLETVFIFCKHFQQYTTDCVTTLILFFSLPLGVPIIYEAKVTKSRNGKLTTIVCQAKGSPLPHVTYYQGMTLITTTPNVIPGHFVVGTMSPQNPLKLAIEYPYMHNDYRCVGRNDFGSSALEFKG